MIALLISLAVPKTILFIERRINNVEWTRLQALNQILVYYFPTQRSNLVSEIFLRFSDHVVSRLSSLASISNSHSDINKWTSASIHIPCTSCPKFSPHLVHTFSSHQVHIFFTTLSLRWFHNPTSSIDFSVDITSNISQRIIRTFFIVRPLEDNIKSSFRSDSNQMT